MKRRMGRVGDGESGRKNSPLEELVPLRQEGWNDVLIIE
jgi:hypothetical protein